MVGPFHRPAMMLALGLLASAGVIDRGASAQAPATGESRPAPPDYALPGEETPKPFVPAQPRTVAEQKRVEALRFYAEARALEDRRQFSDAIKVLDKAAEADPESVPILRRLARLNFALGRDEAAVGFAKRAIAAEPSDDATLGLLIAHYKNDLAAAEEVLKGVAANPKLDKDSAGALLVEFELGKIRAATGRFDEASAAFARLLDALDEAPGVRFSPAERRKILGTDEGQTYLEFGKVFLAAKKPDLAIRAFRRGLVYAPDDAVLILLLAKTYQEAGQGDEALAFIEKFLKRQPRGRESYDLFIDILVMLKREAEILPQLEKFAAADPKNIPLRYLLAERYRLAGRNEKADAVYRTILAEQQDTQKFAALFPVLVQEKKTEDLLRLLVSAVARLRRIEALQPSLEALIADAEYTDKVIDTGIAMISSRPPTLEPREGWGVLATLAMMAKRTDKMIALQRWQVERAPNPQSYRELVTTLFEAAKYPEAAEALTEMLGKFPEERNGQNLIYLAQIQVLGGKGEEALPAIREALRREANDPEIMRNGALLLNMAGQPEEAIDLIRSALRNEPASPDLNESLGRILTRIGRNDEAIAFYKELLEKYPNSDEIGRIAHSGLSIVYTNLGDMAKGEAELELLFARDPDDPGLNNDLGYLYADQGKNLEKAEAMIRKAIAEEPENSAYLDSLGWVLFKRGKYAEAKDPLEKAAAMPRGEDATIQDHLGDVYFQLHDNDKARSAWERAQTLASQSKPPDKRLPEIVKKLQSLRQIEATPRPTPGETP
ncbi:tetratricopeptide repeat protein [Tundrisphaera sp. TA3]|uniref:tetratricopeptide repeat protein n=1 Tax=Tundrisphaera sp. TA3 TaxID=3435775 RepID=UPI003EB6CBDB